MASTKPRSPKGKQKPPEHPVIHLVGVDYFVYWDALPIGASFFLPTIATRAQVAAALQPVEHALSMSFAIHTRVEYGRYGARVWRIQ